jgi:capsular exopolysaccharide synthesis family protein
VARFNLELEAVKNRMKREVEQSEASLSKLAASIAELENRQTEKGSDLVLLRQLEREAEAASIIYETFLSRLKETSVQQGVHKADAIIISEARVPKGRSFPRYRIVLGAALLIGLLLAALVVAILETLDQTFSTPDELERFTGLPVLGLIPNAPITARGNILKFAVSRPTSPFVEAVRNLRTSIQLTGVDGDVKVLALASSAESEGKTLLTMSLAHSSATQSNRKVLVMDCDLRRRRLTAELGGRGLPGIIGYFSGNKTIEEIIHPVENAGFDIMYADKSPKITADIFASVKFEKLIQELRKRYDLIIIDTPPVLALTDVRVIANYVDMVLFTVGWKRTRRKLVRAAMTALSMTKPKRIATVMNRMNIGKSIGYYGSYYYN